ncbi:hypothetical protein RKD39_003214 [Streptomyces albogriseolus]
MPRAAFGGRPLRLALLDSPIAWLRQWGGSEAYACVVGRRTRRRG